ncbi:Hypothetical protein NTJ_14078 [Nesidiocoris tenuis]|uniref:Uncharacterized protein n=1 Tax=Nesidiocoris tenuis TaxID=355587 RepID=A0ABN7BA49_9HEMI|nr:Hypothetical protein NTJ_14078 [Nesidiocoris tenuis]
MGPVFKLQRACKIDAKLAINASFLTMKQAWIPKLKIAVFITLAVVVSLRIKGKVATDKLYTIRNQIIKQFDVNIIIVFHKMFNENFPFFQLNGKHPKSEYSLSQRKRCVGAGGSNAGIITNN